MIKDIKTKLFCFLFIGLLGLINISCGHFYHHKKYKKSIKEGFANIESVNDSKVKGWVRFQKLKDKKALVTAEVKGLKPSQKYGFHIHQYGDCRENAKNSGGHFSVCKSQKHGAPDSKNRHLGDLGNLTADKNGVAHYEAILHRLYLHKIGGRSVIIHAKEDDLKSQPAGNAGPYIACGVVGFTKPLVSLDKHQSTEEKQPKKSKAKTKEKFKKKVKDKEKVKEKASQKDIKAKKEQKKPKAKQ